jgi:hypothetical protein
MNLRHILAVFEPIGQYAERQRFRLRDSFVPRCSVGEDTWQLGDLADPAAIGLPLDIDREVTHAAMVNRPIPWTKPRSAERLKLTASSQGWHCDAAGRHPGTPNMSARNAEILTAAGRSRHATPFARRLAVFVRHLAVFVQDWAVLVQDQAVFVRHWAVFVRRLPVSLGRYEVSVGPYCGEG